MGQPLNLAITVGLAFMLASCGDGNQEHIPGKSTHPTASDRTNRNAIGAEDGGSDDDAGSSDDDAGGSDDDAGGSDDDAGGSDDDAGSEEDAGSDDAGSDGGATNPDICFGHWGYGYYSDPFFINEVGIEACDCGRYTSYGQKTIYRKSALMADCPGGPY
ncbi:hypothetical protein [Myxococcus sp. CA039A]|uniref:hypothetical protein n=1 Tax=Myxococcus sp. CA039A TaxID=2741737 RepID=UPI00157A8223|nr:hypothetical protein [Myxococcus sp. CA039A]NTX54600.1 hypothetical protein [Myxococcus sp. CA039A]